MSVLWFGPGEAVEVVTIFAFFSVVAASRRPRLSAPMRAKCEQLVGRSHTSEQRRAEWGSRVRDCHQWNRPGCQRGEMSSLVLACYDPAHHAMIGTTNKKNLRLPAVVLGGAIVTAFGFAGSPQGAPPQHPSKAILLGVGSPVITATRAGTSIAIIAGDRAYVFDAGPGVERRLLESTAQFSSLGAAELGDLAKRARPKHFVLYHTLGASPEELIARIRQSFAGQITYGRELGID